MVKRRRVILGLVLFGLVAGLSWLVVRQTRLHTFTLPDGSHLFLHRVTVGSNVPMNFGSALDKMLARVPGKAGARFRRNVWTDESDREALVFWFEFERSPASNSMVNVEFIDLERRRKFQPESWLPAQTLPNGRVVASCALPVWPRRDRTLAVQVFLEDPERPDGDEGERHEIGTLTVKNPGYRP